MTSELKETITEVKDKGTVERETRKEVSTTTKNKDKDREKDNNKV